WSVFFPSRRRHTRSERDWSSDVCSSALRASWSSVANLNTRNDQLRTEIATLDQEARTLAAGQSRGDTSVGQLQTDLSEVRAWAEIGRASCRERVGGWAGARQRQTRESGV